MSGVLPVEDQILVALRRATRAIDLRSRMLLQQNGLTSPQLLTLLAVARLQPVTATKVAREIHLGQPTVTGILARLERRGWIARTRGEPDGRSISIRLTPAGEESLSRAPSLLHPQFKSAFRQLREWEQTQLLASLQRLADMLDPELPDSGLSIPDADLPHSNDPQKDPPNEAGPHSKAMDGESLLWR